MNTEPEAFTKWWESLPLYGGNQNYRLLEKESSIVYRPDCLAIWNAAIESTKPSYVELEHVSKEQEA